MINASSIGNHREPPRTRRRDYGKVILQLLWRMKLDLIIWFIVVWLFVLGSFSLSRSLPSILVSVIGIAVSIFIAFRNTQAMSRWWEARALWGTMINGSRIWRDTLLGLINENQLATDRGNMLLKYQVAKAWLLNFRLRNFWLFDVHEAVMEILEDLNLPSDTSLQEICRQQAISIQRLYSDGWIDTIGRMQLLEANKFDHNAIGALEKIRNTPIPPAYDIFIRLITWIYGVTLLITFHDQDHGLLGIILFLGFLIAERIGAYIEGPFDRDGSSFSLPLNSFCCIITEDLLNQDLRFASFRPSIDPVKWE
jgi:ion channel-forming bestrophin family protein